jgi:hypothetical protein
VIGFCQKGLDEHEGREVNSARGQSLVRQREPANQARDAHALVGNILAEPEMSNAVREQRRVGHRSMKPAMVQLGEVEQ